MTFIGDLGGKYCVQSICYAVLAVCLFVLYFYLRRRNKNFYSKLVLVIAVISFFRLIFFYNPFIWFFYNKILINRDIGYMYVDKIKIEKSKYERKYFLSPDYLAVGNSQVNFIFNREITRNVDFFSFAGNTILGYLSQKELILDRKPKKIILYLGEKAFGSKLLVDRSPIKPDTSDLLSVYNKIFNEHSGSEETTIHDFSGPIVDSLFEKVFPEIKYSYVFKGLLNKLSNFNYQNQKFDDEKDYIVHALDKLSDEMVYSLKYGGYEKFHKLNLDFVERFIALSNERKIPVVIIEAQYHPIGYTPYTLDMEGKVKDGLHEIVRKYPNAVYIEKEKLYNFKSEDFFDGYHIKPEPAKVFLQSLKKLYPDIELL